MLGGRRTLSVIGFLCVGTVLWGCSSKVDLSLKLKPGDKRVVEITKDMTMTMTAGGRDQSMPQKNVETYRYEVESVDPAGVATVKVTTNVANLLEGMQAGALMGMQEGSALAGLSESTVTAQVARDGTVLSVSGMASIAETAAKKIKEAVKAQIDAKMDSADPKVKGMMGAMGNVDAMVNKIAEIVRRALSDDAMKQQLQQLTDCYPSAPVGKGSTWTRERNLSASLPLKSTETYRVTARGGGLTNLAVQNALSSSSENLDFGMGSVKANLSGQQTGTVQIEEATGWITAASLTVKVEGTVETGGMSIPVKIEGTVYQRTYAG